MKRLTLLALFAVAVLSVPHWLFASIEAVTKADHLFVEAASKADQKGIANLLDDNFTWTDSSGKTYSKADFANNLAKSAFSAETKPHDYGSVAYLTGVSGQYPAKLRFVRVWVNGKDGWRLLLFQETKLVGKVATPQATVPAGTACDNPCKTVPYDAPSADAKAVVSSWQALEDAVNHRDADGWASHVADEFVFNVKEDGNPLTKADRMNIIRKQSEGKTVTDIGTVVPGTMQVWIYVATAVMADEQQPTIGGNPYRAMRIWVKRDDRWRLVYSQQTVIEK
jgi:hypothetical protein